MSRLAFGGAEAGHEHVDRLALTISGGSYSVDSGRARSGQRSFKFSSAAAVASQAYLTSPSGPGATDVTYFFRAWIYFTSLPPADMDVLMPRGATNLSNGRLILRTDGRVQQGSQPALSAPLAPNTWHCLALACKRPSDDVIGNLVSSRVNGVTLNSNVREAFNSGVTTFRFGVAVNSAINNATGWNLWADDWAFNDDTGTEQNSWPGTSERIVLLRPVADSALGNWTLGAGGSPAGAAWDSIDNEPPTGKSNTTATNGDQIRNNVASTTQPGADADFELQDFIAAGVPSDATIRAIRATAELGTAGITTPNLALRFISNPTEATEDTGGAGASAAGTFTTNWQNRAGPILHSPAVALATRPVLRIGERVTATHLVCFAGAYVAYTPSAPPPPVVATRFMVTP